MDVISALARYRRSVLSDERAYYILHLLYLRGEADEKALAKDADLSMLPVKEAIRELHQASFLGVKKSGNVFLTTLAEGILSQLGADRVVIPFLIDQLVSKQNSRSLQVFAEWALKVEPERARSTTRALRNLQSYKNLQSISEDDSNNLAMLCLSPTVSKTRSLLINYNASRFFSQAGVDQTHWNSILDDYNAAISAADKADLILIRPGSLDVNSEISISTCHYISFKTYNFIQSGERDYLFEQYVEQLGHKPVSPLWKLVWSRAKEVWHSVFGDVDVNQEEDIAGKLSSKIIREVERRRETVLQSIIEVGPANEDESSAIVDDEDRNARIHHLYE